MNTLFLYNTKTLKEKFNTKVFAGDNLITKINVQLPDNIGGYPKAECEFNLRAIIPEGNMSYFINPDSPYFYVTNDITETAQTVKLMMIITHAGNVIGRTNTVDLVVNEPAEAPDPPLTPREEFDEVIAEQRAEIAEQAETINSQASQIEQDTETISSLNTQVSELTTENDRLETQHTADQNTIQYLIDNPPEARLQPKSVTPTNQMQVVEPDEGYQGMSTVTVGAVTPPRLQSKQVAPSLNTTYVSADSNYDGLSSVTVDNVTASIDPNIQPENIKKDVVVVGVRGTYDPFPEHSVGGIYITEVDEDGYPVKFLVKNVGKIASTFPIIYQNVVVAKTRIKQFVFENCADIKGLAANNAVSGYFEGMTNISKIELPENILWLDAYMFYNCVSLKQIKIPATLSTIAGSAFNNCSSLENATIENGFNCNGLNLSSSILYSVETIVSWLEALADRTGETAYTLTMGTTNLNKLTNEQKAIATNKNWNLA